MWASGGLNFFNFDNSTHLAYTESRQSFMSETLAPPLPEARILHCLVMINETHAFLHGGRTPLEPFKIHKPQLFGRTIRIGSQNMYKYNGRIIENVTASQSYLFSWNTKEWSKVTVTFAYFN